MQRPQVFLHFFLPSAPLQKVASFAFVVHHVAPKLMGTLSSHVGGGAHGVAARHVFLHFFLIFLHAFFVSVSSQTPKAASQSSLQASTSTELLHGGGAGEGGGDGGDGGGEVGGVGCDGDGGGGDGDSGGGLGRTGGDAQGVKQFADGESSLPVWQGTM